MALQTGLNKCYVLRLLQTRAWEVLLVQLLPFFLQSAGWIPRAACEWLFMLRLALRFRWLFCVNSYKMCGIKS